MMVAGARRRRAVFASRQEAYDNYAGKPPLDALDARGAAGLRRPRLPRPAGRLGRAGLRTRAGGQHLRGRRPPGRLRPPGRGALPGPRDGRDAGREPAGDDRPGRRRRRWPTDGCTCSPGSATSGPCRIPRPSPGRSWPSPTRSCPDADRGAGGDDRSRHLATPPAYHRCHGVPGADQPLAVPGRVVHLAARWRSASPASRSCPSRPARTPPRAPSSTGRSSCSSPGAGRAHRRRPAQRRSTRPSRSCGTIPSFADLELDPGGGGGVRGRRRRLVDAYFELEDPRRGPAASGSSCSSRPRSAACTCGASSTGWSWTPRASSSSPTTRPAGPPVVRARAGPARRRPLLRLPVRAGRSAGGRRRSGCCTSAPAIIIEARPTRAVGPLPAQAHRGRLAGHRAGLRDRRLPAPARAGCATVRVPGLVPGVRRRPRPGRARGAGALRPRARPAARSTPRAEPPAAAPVTPDPCSARDVGRLRGALRRRVRRRARAAPGPPGQPTASSTTASALGDWSPDLAPRRRRPGR